MLAAILVSFCIELVLVVVVVAVGDFIVFGLLNDFSFDLL